LVEHICGLGGSVLVVDDASPDGTADIAKQAGASVLARPGKQGLASAYTQGLARALESGSQTIIQMDADLSHDPNDLPRLLESIKHGADLVLGSRYVPGGKTKNWGLHRRILSRFGSIYARAWLGLDIKDLTGGFKAWKSDLIQQIDLTQIHSEGYAFQVEMTWNAHKQGANIQEIPITFTERRAGRSKMSRSIAIEAAMVVPTLRWRP